VLDISGRGVGTRKGRMRVHMEDVFYIHISK
jgi:hypothetical protein